MKKILWLIFGIIIFTSAAHAREPKLWTQIYCGAATVEAYTEDKDNNGLWDQMTYYLVNREKPYAVIYIDEKTTVATGGEINGRKYDSFEKLQANEPNVCQAALEALEREEI